MNNPDPVPPGINARAVTDWLTAEIDSLQPPFQFELLAGGHSNLTYAVTDQRGVRCVLRRPPLGGVLQSAHDMGREHRVISALAGNNVPVPETLGLCRDENVNDAPFYVMSFVEGLVLHDADAARTLSENERLSLSDHCVEVLAALHAIKPESVGLDDLSRHDSYIARQLKRWERQWDATRTRAVAAMDDALALLKARMPEQVGTSIVHGDYRLGNQLVADGRIQAVLDWELCTLGDALADVGYLLNTWVGPNDAIAGMDDHMPTLIGGFAPREALAERYAAASGRDLGNINYYRAFAYWRIAAIRQGVYKRYLDGAMGDQEGIDLARYEASVEIGAQAALELLE